MLFPIGLFILSLLGTTQTSDLTFARFSLICHRLAFLVALNELPNCFLRLIRLHKEIPPTRLFNCHTELCHFFSRLRFTYVYETTCLTLEYVSSEILGGKLIKVNLSEKFACCWQAVVFSSLVPLFPQKPNFHYVLYCCGFESAFLTN